MKYISLQMTPFDVGAEMMKLQGDHRGTHSGTHNGAISSFTGLVRQNIAKDEKNIVSLLIEHHPVMTKMALNILADDIMQRLNVSGIIIIHLHGSLAVGDPIVFVAASSPHRKEAMEAVTYVMDRLKTDVPLWKKEIYTDGTSCWIEQKQSDIARSDAWN